MEALCSATARRWMRRNGMPEHDLESLVAFLVSEVWRASERYDPVIAPSFRSIVIGQLTNRCVDWVRKERKRTRWQFSDRRSYEREIPKILSLDVLVESGDGRSLGEPVDPVNSDPASGADPDPFGGLLDERDSEGAQDSAVVYSLARGLLRERGRGSRAA